MSIVNIGHNTPKWWWSVGRWWQPSWLSILVPIFFFSTWNNDFTRKGNETHERGEYAGVYLIGKCPDSFFSGEWLSPETLLLSSVLPRHSPSFQSHTAARLFLSVSDFWFPASSNRPQRTTGAALAFLWRPLLDSSISLSFAFMLGDCYSLGYLRFEVAGLWLNRSRRLKMEN